MNDRTLAIAALALLGLTACSDRSFLVGAEQHDTSLDSGVTDATTTTTPDSGDPNTEDAATAPDTSPAAPDASSPDAGDDADVPPEEEICLDALAACNPGGEACCGELTCGNTTAGQVCCGGEGASCATPDGSDCCGTSLLCVGGTCQPPGGPAPNFSAPFPCGERWTYDHHANEVRLAVDFIRADGVVTNGSVQVASAPGIATRHSQPGGAGNYIVINHGDGWVTYYFHLSDYIAQEGAWVDRGEPIGRTGSTGASSGPHIHYEQLKNGVGQIVHFEGVSLAPYPSYYNEKFVVSENSCSREGRYFSTWGSNRNVHASPTRTSPVVATLAGPMSVLIDCQLAGEEVTTDGYTNQYWSHLPDHGGYITNIYINDAAAYLPGVPDCP